MNNDAELIAEAEREATEDMTRFYKETGSIRAIVKGDSSWREQFAKNLLRLQRESLQPQPKPDLATKVWKEARRAFGDAVDFEAGQRNAAAVFRKYLIRPSPEVLEAAVEIKNGSLLSKERARILTNFVLQFEEEE